MANNLTYAKSGVNIRSADKFVKYVAVCKPVQVNPERTRIY